MQIYHLLLLSLAGNHRAYGMFNVGNWFERMTTYMHDVGSSMADQSWKVINGQWHNKVSISPTYTQEMGKITVNGKGGSHLIDNDQSIVTFRYGPRTTIKPTTTKTTTPSTTIQLSTQLSEAILDEETNKPNSDRGSDMMMQMLGLVDDTKSLMDSLVDLSTTLDNNDQEPEQIPTLFDNAKSSSTKEDIVISVRLAITLTSGLYNISAFEEASTTLQEALDNVTFDDIKLAELQSSELVDTFYTEWENEMGSYLKTRFAMNTNINFRFISTPFPEDPLSFTSFDDNTIELLLEEIATSLNTLKPKEIMELDDIIYAKDLHVVDETTNTDISIDSLEEGSGDSETKCFSDDCWYFDEPTQRCQVKHNAIGRCYDLICAHDEIRVIFSSTLFGITDGEAFPFGTDLLNNCHPTWDEASSAWTWSSALGSCGMEVGRYSSTAQLGFNVTLTADKKHSLIANNEFVTTSAHGRINFECTYLTSIDLTTTTSQQNSFGSQAHDVGSESGHSLAHGFSISTHTDWRFQGMQHRVKMGSPLFVEVKWSLTGLGGRVQFYVKHCALKDETKSLDIVQDNCYSKTVNAALVSRNHLVDHNSRFKYETFTFAKKNTGAQVLQCSVELCLASEDCINRQCDSDSHMSYSLFGMRNEEITW